MASIWDSIFLNAYKKLGQPDSAFNPNVAATGKAQLENAFLSAYQKGSGVAPDAGAIDKFLGKSLTESYAADVILGNTGAPQIESSILPNYFATNPVPKPMTAVGPSPFAPKFDEGLATKDLLMAAGKSSTERAREIIAPQLPFIRQDVSDFVNAQVADAASDATRRGITGSSTELGGMAQIRSEGANTLARAEAELLMKALPFAQQE